MKVKILFFIQSLSGGGAERTIINILNKLDRTKFNLLLVVGNLENNTYMEFLSKDISVIDLKTRRVRYSFFKLRNIIAFEKPNILFTTMNHNNIMLSLVKLSLNNTSYRPKLILREASYRHESKRIPLVNRVLTKFCYSIVADGIIALSNGVREDLSNKFNISKKKIRVIYNPIDLNQINKLKSEEVYDEEFYGDYKLLISVGRLVEVKDYPTLFKAVQIVSRSIKIKVIICGVGQLENKLKKLTKDLGIDKIIIFKGFLRNPYKYMKNSDAFILSSINEGFGHVIVESMACGTPVISTNCNAGPKEIITNNLNGKLVEVGDFTSLAKAIIETLISNNDRQISNALSRALDFDVDKIIKEYELYFNDIEKNK